MDSPHIKSSCDTKSKFQSYGYRVGIDYVTWRKILKWIPPTSNLHVGHKINSNPMGIGLGIDYVTWRKILKWIPPLHVTSKPYHRIGIFTHMKI